MYKSTSSSLTCGLWSKTSHHCMLLKLANLLNIIRLKVVDNRVGGRHLRMLRTALPPDPGPDPRWTPSKSNLQWTRRN